MGLIPVLRLLDPLSAEEMLFARNISKGSMYPYMDILPVGVGGAGCEIAETFLEYAERTGWGTSTGFAVDTSESEFYSNNRISEKNSIVLDPENIQLSETNDTESLKVIVENRPTSVDCFLVIGGLGGKTGTHAGEIADWIQNESNIPVYGLGVLPTNDEGAFAALRATSGLNSLNAAAEGVIVFDNDAWAQGGELQAEALNDEIVKRLGLLFQAAGKVDVSPPTQLTQSALEKSLASNEYITVGYAAEEVPSQDGGLLSRFKNSKNQKDRREEFASLAKKSALGRLTLPGEVSSSSRGLIISCGPEDYITKSHVDAAETGFRDVFGRGFTDSEIGTVESASFEIKGAEYVAVLTVFSDLGRQPRLVELEQTAQKATGQPLENRSQLEELNQSSRSLTDRLESMDDTEWNRDYLLSFSPEEFEHLVAELYRVIGDDSEVTQASRDGGVDITVEQMNGVRLVVQVKQYQPENRVGKPTVQQTIGAREERNADVAVVVTSSSFSTPAQDLAEKSGDSVRLISGRELVDSLVQSSLNPSNLR